MQQIEREVSSDSRFSSDVIIVLSSDDEDGDVFSVSSECELNNEPILISDDEDSLIHVPDGSEIILPIEEQHNSQHRCDIRRKEKQDPLHSLGGQKLVIPKRERSKFISLSNQCKKRIDEDKERDEPPDLNVTDFPDVPTQCKIKNYCKVETLKDIQDVKKCAKDGENLDFLTNETVIRKKTGDNLYEPPSKVMRVENHGNVNEWQEEFVSITRRKMCTTLLRGAMKVTIHSLMCHNHNTQKTFQMNTVSQALADTMMANDCLQSFAIRWLCKSVTCHSYLGQTIVLTLLKYLVGCKDKMEIAPVEDFSLGIATLRKQLTFHPTSKPSMRPYYVQICKRFWPVILEKLENFLQDKTSQPQTKISSEPTENEEMDSSSHELSMDFSQVIWKIQKEKRRRFKEHSREKEMQRIHSLLKYFIDIFQTNLQYWFLKYWRDKFPAFRADLKPILVELAWPNEVDIGHANFTIKRILDLYCKTVEYSFHNLLGIVVGMYAAIIHRWEKSVCPEMDNLTRGYAGELFRRVKCLPHMELNVEKLTPDWLKFHVVSAILDIGEIPNYYKLKERIVQSLEAKDRGQNESTFDIEKICYHGLQAMMGMLELHARSPSMLQNTCLVTAQLLDDDLENVWFKESLHQQDIFNNIKTIKSLLNARCVKGRPGFDSIFVSEINKI